ncbi:MAG TPA: hypothetical protein VFK33_01465 [Bacillales bacterium]|nr:hypothetical protein [Bacillales bacterium]
MSAVIRQAEEKDQERLNAFAAASGVSTEGVRGELKSFYLMEDEEHDLMAMAGFEALDSDGLLRALVLNPKRCELDDIVHFFNTLVAEAGKSGFKTLWLVTPSPEIFGSFGFEKADGSAISDQVKAAVDQSTDAVVMSRKL